MNKQILKDYLGWGLFLWLIGYILGIVFFMLVPRSMIGWFIMPVGIIITLWVLFEKIKSNSFEYYLGLGIAWALIAVILDYIFIVNLFNESSYYKLDVYLYYIITFTLPLIVGWKNMIKK